MNNTCECGKEIDKRSKRCQSCAGKITGKAGRGISRNKGNSACGRPGHKDSHKTIQKRLDSRGINYSEGPVWTQGERGQKNAWSRDVKRRDHKCVYCGSEERLHSHHILSAHKHPEFRLFIDNGITLCHTCHWDEHRLNGYL